MHNGLARAILASLVISACQLEAQDNSEPQIDLDDLRNWHGTSTRVETVIPDAAPTTEAARGIVGPAARQPTGALAGRIVFMNSGHGWTYETNTTTPYWRLQRPAALNSMNEDYGNLDQLNFFAAYCFNAGAVVASMRPLGQQTNEVVLDNDDAGVTFVGP